MCTVSFIPLKDTFFITSNRDEKPTRQKALKPGLHFHNGYKLLFPRDAAAGGTWIAVKENGDAAVLLNGAFISHTPEPPYRKSRGLVFLDIFCTDRPAVTFSRTGLAGIEPFTYVLLEKGCLYEFRWNGSEKFCKQLPVNRPHIWSSATLYDGLIMKKREQWFAEFLNKTPRPTQQDILHFHRFSGDGNSHTDLLMNRDQYATVSITSIQLTANRAVLKYIDVTENKVSDIKMELLQPQEIL